MPLPPTIRTSQLRCRKWLAVLGSSRPGARCDSNGNPQGSMTEAIFYPVAELGELASANPLRKEVNGWPLLIVRDGEEIHAFYNVCTHAWARMSGARISEGAIICPYHGAQFDVRTGRC